MVKLDLGLNDLATLYPDIAAEANGWDPSTLLPSSNKKVSWKCKAHGHIWEARSNNRTSTHKTNCPVCSGRECWTGVNDLKTLQPDLAKEAYGWDPSKVKAQSNKKLPWKCKAHGHTWLAEVVNRTSNKKLSSLHQSKSLDWI